MPLQPIVSNKSLLEKLKTDIPEQCMHYMQQIKLDIEILEISSRALIDSINTNQEEDNNKKAKRKICKLILDKRDSLKALSFSIESLFKTFNSSEKSLKECMDIRTIFEGMKNIFYKIKIIT